MTAPAMKRLLILQKQGRGREGLQAGLPHALCCQAVSSMATGCPVFGRHIKYVNAAGVCPHGPKLPGVNSKEVTAAAACSLAHPAVIT